MKRVFVLSGKQGSGKTTYAKYLQAMLGTDNTKIFKFAEPLYAIHDRCLPVLKELGIRPKEMEKDGELLQVLGTEYGRKRLGENVWVYALLRKIHPWVTASEMNFAIIDDCRFENEFDALKEDAYMIRLQAPEDVRKARCSYWREDVNHISETGLDEYARALKFDVLMNTDGIGPKDQLEKFLKHLGFIE